MSTPVPSATDGERMRGSGRAADLPATASLTYLNTGSAGPLSTAAANAMSGALQRELTQGRAGQTAWEAFLAGRHDLRTSLGGLVEATADEIMLTHHTTEGLNVALWGLDWRSGDRILVTNLEHSAGLAAVASLAARFGLLVDVVDCGLGERTRSLAALQVALATPARLLVASHVSWATGAVLPLAEMIELAHHAGTAVLVDGAQAVGAIPVNVARFDADFYAFNGYKWLCGPEGTGALVVRERWLDRLRVSHSGAFGVDETTLDARALDHVVAVPGAGRYETGSWSRPNLAGLLAALQWFVDRETRGDGTDRVRSVAEYCRARLTAELGATVHTPDGQTAGLVAFTVPGIDTRIAVTELERAGVIIRRIPTLDFLRVSCACFSEYADIDVLVRSLSELTAVRSS